MAVRKRLCLMWPCDLALKPSVRMWGKLLLVVLKLCFLWATEYCMVYALWMETHTIQTSYRLGSEKSIFTGLTIEYLYVFCVRQVDGSIQVRARTPHRTTQNSIRDSKTALGIPTCPCVILLSQYSERFSMHSTLKLHTVSCSIHKSSQYIIKFHERILVQIALEEISIF